MIGANARRLRQEGGLTLDHIALAARYCGLPWSTGRVGDLEAGRVLPNLETLYAVALALSQATGHKVRLVDLLATSEPLQINDDLIVDPQAVSDAVHGKPVTGETESYRKLGEALQKHTRPMLERAVLHGFREADARMCKTIGVTPERGAKAMTKLWGRPFSVERDRLAGPDANAQRRGQISRQLKAEIVKAIQQREDR